ncbi:ap endonuclease-like protein [Dinothrombium tinctorium]|uniref:DNA-(apurinic or apyrimidinic site) endonuclease n=1 Tax=Dinothrombium tinctorium TaxID=1965070 RepID=A0A3S3SG01_9ACAR|nr:ap endonuclease-like protein [Dinothrombium tinctorium]
MNSLKIVTWNVNGLRSAKHTVLQMLESHDVDIYCFQETKISRNQIDDSIAFVPDYSAYFSFPKVKSGYSGVVTYCSERVRPFDAQESFVTNGETFDFIESQLKELESEGRTMITKHLFMDDKEQMNLFLINVYCPRADPENPDRLIFKLNFYRLMESKVRQLLQNENTHILILGDINTSCKRIDHCDPDDEFDESPCRQWLNDFFTISNDKPYFIDIFRHLHPETKNAFTCWNTRMNARETNYGTRIDYCICNNGFLRYVEDCVHLTDVMGSDHCPVMLKMKNIKILTSPSYPKLSTKFWPEFGVGTKQMKMTAFLHRVDSNVMERENKESSSRKRQKTTSIKQYLSIVSRKSSTFTQSNNTLVTESKLNEECGQTASQQAMFEKISASNDAVIQWKNVLCGPPKPPLCTGHNIPSTLRTVTKVGPNRGRQFFVCSRPVGPRNDPTSQCGFFKWAK